MSEDSGFMFVSIFFVYCRCSLFLKDLFFSRLFRGCNSCYCFCVEFVKLLLVHQYSVDIFHILVHQEYWVLTESRIPLVLGI